MPIPRLHGHVVDIQTVCHLLYGKHSTGTKPFEATLQFVLSPDVVYDRTGPGKSVTGGESTRVEDLGDVGLEVILQ